MFLDDGPEIFFFIIHTRSSKGSRSTVKMVKKVKKLQGATWTGGKPQDECSHKGHGYSDGFNLEHKANAQRKDLSRVIATYGGLPTVEEEKEVSSPHEQRDNVCRLTNLRTGRTNRFPKKPFRRSPTRKRRAQGRR